MMMIIAIIIIIIIIIIINLYRYTRNKKRIIFQFKF